MTKIMIVDPPSGWKYGFPKQFSSSSPKEDNDYVKFCLDEMPDESWFLENGYPKELIDEGMLKYCRYWYEEI